MKLLHFNGLVLVLILFCRPNRTKDMAKTKTQKESIIENTSALTPVGGLSVGLGFCQ